MGPRVAKPGCPCRCCISVSALELWEGLPNLTALQVPCFDMFDYLRMSVVGTDAKHITRGNRAKINSVWDNKRFAKKGIPLCRSENPNQRQSKWTIPPQDHSGPSTIVPGVGVSIHRGIMHFWSQGRPKTSFHTLPNINLRFRGLDVRPLSPSQTSPVERTCLAYKYIYVINILYIYIFLMLYIIYICFFGW